MAHRGERSTRRHDRSRLAPIPGFHRLAAAAAALCLLVSPRAALAGPPYQTDDPEPVELHHGEFYVASQYDRSRGDVSATIPHLELNYGALRETQLHVIVPLALDEPASGPGHHGLGDIEIGVKVRFLRETARRPQVGTFPLVEAPSGNSERGLGGGHFRVFLPLWVQKSWGPWQSYGGAGWWRNPGDGNRDFVFAGWQLQRQVSRKLAVGAEVVDETRSSDDDSGHTGVNVGAVFDATEHHHLLVSAGTCFRGDRHSWAYAAYQLTFGRAGGSD